MADRDDSGGAAPSVNEEAEVENPLARVFRRRQPFWQEPKRDKQAEPEHPRWQNDVYFRSGDGVHKALAIMMDSPGAQQRIRDWLVTNNDARTVTAWIHDLIDRELPDEGWDYRDGWDPKVLQKG